MSLPAPLEDVLIGSTLPVKRNAQQQDKQGQMRAHSKTAEELQELKQACKKECLELDELYEFVRDCTRCELCESRNQLVFGWGNPQADIMIVGEAPGANEDKSGRPFVGASGKNLDAYLEALSCTREDIYIANILKCRPPSNRNPRADEIALCAPFLREQIRAIQPRYLITLGNFATKFVLKTERGITELHGKFFELGSYTVMPSFHPAAALYDRKKHPLIQEDFERLAQHMHKGE